MKTSEDFYTYTSNGKRKFLISNGVYVSYLSTLMEYSHKKMESVGVAFFPLYIKDILGINAEKCVDKILKLEHIKELCYNDLIQQSPEQISEMLQNFINNKEKKHIHPDIRSLYNKIIKSKDYDQNMKYFSSSTGYSSRYLQTLFKKNIGMPPKKIHSIDPI